MRDATVDRAMAGGQEDVMKLGFIGLGKMGRPMTRHLLAAGHEVWINNRSQGVVQELAGEGAQPAASPRAVADAADIVMTCLPTTATIEHVYAGPDGLFSAARQGHIFIDHSTVNPNLSRDFADRAASKGAGFLDAPVSGGPAGATAATLTIMVGGDPRTFDQALPVLQVMGKNIHHIGPSGAGSIIKLTNQLLVAIHTAASVEAAVFAVKAGVDPTFVKEVIGTSFGGSAMLNRNIPLFIERKFAGGTPVNLILKDLGLIADYTNELQLRTLMVSQATQVFAEGRAAGLGDLDMSALVQALEQLSGVDVSAAGN
jgi:3-hydroxyisobutyrate dehydrogenase/2-hydroxy-3-oxopropionate reductase